MKNVLKNKKGFTLVELLAVIVILALIMGIAVVAMSGVIENSKKKAAFTTAASMINGVRQKLTIEDQLPTTTTSYYFTSELLERGGVVSPLGGNYAYVTPTNGVVSGATKISDGIYKITGNAPTCSAGVSSYVTVEVNGDQKVYKICLTAGSTESYIYGNESDIESRLESLIKPAA